MYQRSAWALLEPVRKGKGDCGASKNWQEVLVKTARSSGRMRGETPNRVWEREELGKKYTGTGRRLRGNESSPVMWPGPPTGRVEPSGKV